MPVIRATLFLLVFGLGLALAQSSPSADRSIVYAVSSVDGSGVSGVAYVGAFGSDDVTVVLALEGSEAGNTHPAHFHVGDCGSGGGIEVPLAPVDGATGLSVSRTRVAFEEIVGSDLYVNVHRSADALESIYACGEVGTGVSAIAEAGSGMDASMGADASDGMGADAAADPDAEADAQETSATPDTASYGLFPVEGSGISGQVQLTELTLPGTKFVITLVGIDEGQRYDAALFEGNCGPDRPKVRDLSPISEFEDDPFVSITDTSLSFDTVTDGDHFLYIYASPDSERIVACGEVGAGANR